VVHEPPEPEDLAWRLRNRAPAQNKMPNRTPSNQNIHPGHLL